jgi:isopentenyl diphosphate isomerase/L-lactate dehydrogenase-like FMN-dependent dehydrogenase
VSTEAAAETIAEVTRELRIAMFAAGAGDIPQLQKTPLQRL